MDGPVLYSLKPLIGTTSEFKTSCPMYKLKNLLKSSVDKADVTAPVEKSIPLQDEKNIESRQEKLLTNLLHLQEQISAFRNRLNELKTLTTASVDVDTFSLFARANIRDFVINADPQYPPYSLLWLPKLWNIPIKVSVHTHSSVLSLPPNLTVFSSLQTNTPDLPYINMTFVWKDVGPDTQLIVSPLKIKTIHGEVNILRFFDYILHSDEVLGSTRKNEVLDLAHRLSYTSSRDENVIFTRLQEHLGKDEWFLQSLTPTVADAGVWSALIKLKKQSSVLTPTLGRWMSSCTEFLGENVSM